MTCISRDIAYVWVHDITLRLLLFSLTFFLDLEDLCFADLSGDTRSSSSSSNKSYAFPPATWKQSWAKWPEIEIHDCIEFTELYTYPYTQNSTVEDLTSDLSVHKIFIFHYVFRLLSLNHLWDNKNKRSMGHMGQLRN